MNIQISMLFGIVLILTLWLAGKYLRGKGKSGNEAANSLQRIVVLIAVVLAVGLSFLQRPQQFVLWEHTPSEIWIKPMDGEEIMLGDEQIAQLEKLSEEKTIKPIGLASKFQGHKLIIMSESGEKIVIREFAPNRVKQGKWLYQGDFSNIDKWFKEVE
ncbi:MAG: hypothetical protein GXZ11_02390 [Tissierellia bacterium]|nr:hypothetical protein [Tissierellia bacterium]